jgi:pimeloyl-ACP methyl ester carboxylesterase
MMHVTSKDGTHIAYERTGEGPALILIGGAFCGRHAKASGTPLAALLAERLSVYSYDRRGRGDSDDSPPYTIARELEDIAALIAAAGGKASLYGMSSGAFLALAAAQQGLGVDKLAVYEAPLHPDADVRSQALADELTQLTAAGKRSQAAALFLTRVVQVPAAAVSGMQHAPMWPGMCAIAHTLSYDVQICAQAPALLERLRSVQNPALILSGGRSPDWMQAYARELAQALPHASHRVLEGQTHDVDPSVLADALTRFLCT